VGIFFTNNPNFYLLKGLEIICGIAILGGYYKRLAMVILAPIVVNILLFHVFLAPAGLPMAIVLTGLLAYLAYTEREE